MSISSYHHPASPLLLCKPHFDSKPPNLAAARPERLLPACFSGLFRLQDDLPHPIASSFSKVTPPLQLVSGKLYQIQQLPLSRSSVVSLQCSMTSQFKTDDNSSLVEFTKWNTWIHWIQWKFAHGMKRKSTKRSLIEASRTWPAAFCVLRQFPSLFQAAGDETDRPHFSLRPSTEPRRRSNQQISPKTASET